MRALTSLLVLLAIAQTTCATTGRYADVDGRDGRSDSVKKRADANSVIRAHPPSVTLWRKRVDGADTGADTGTQKDETDETKTTTTTDGTRDSTTRSEGSDKTTDTETSTKDGSTRSTDGSTSTRETIETLTKATDASVTKSDSTTRTTTDQAASTSASASASAGKVDNAGQSTRSDDPLSATTTTSILSTDASPSGVTAAAFDSSPLASTPTDLVASSSGQTDVPTDSSSTADDQTSSSVTPTLAVDSSTLLASYSSALDSTTQVTSGAATITADPGSSLLAGAPTSAATAIATASPASDSSTPDQPIASTASATAVSTAISSPLVDDAPLVTFDPIVSTVLAGLPSSLASALSSDLASVLATAAADTTVMSSSAVVSTALTAQPSAVQPDVVPATPAVPDQSSAVDPVSAIQSAIDQVASAAGVPVAGATVTSTDDAGQVVAASPTAQAAGLANSIVSAVLASVTPVTVSQAPVTTNQGQIVGGTDTTPSTTDGTNDAPTVTLSATKVFTVVVLPTSTTNDDGITVPLVHAITIGPDTDQAVGGSNALTQTFTTLVPSVVVIGSTSPTESAQSGGEVAAGTTQPSQGAPSSTAAPSPVTTTVDGLPLVFTPSPAAVSGSATPLTTTVDGQPVVTTPLAAAATASATTAAAASATAVPTLGGSASVVTGVATFTSDGSVFTSAYTSTVPSGSLAGAASLSQAASPLSGISPTGSTPTAAASVVTTDSTSSNSLYNWVPTTLDAAPTASMSSMAMSSSLQIDSENDGSATQSMTTVTVVAFPTNYPRAIAESSIPDQPQDSAMGNIAFSQALNWEWLVTSSAAAAQIFRTMPEVIASALSINSSDVVNYLLQPYQSISNPNTLTSVYSFYYPQDQEDRLSSLLADQNSALYSGQTSDLAIALVGNIDPSFPLTPDHVVQTTLAANSSDLSQSDTNPMTDDGSRTVHSIIIAVAVSCATAVYALLAFFAIRWWKKRQTAKAGQKRFSGQTWSSAAPSQHNGLYRNASTTTTSSGGSGTRRSTDGPAANHPSRPTSYVDVSGRVHHPKASMSERAGTFIPWRGHLRKRSGDSVGSGTTASSSGGPEARSTGSHNFQGESYPAVASNMVKPNSHLGMGLWTTAGRRLSSALDGVRSSTDMDRPLQTYVARQPSTKVIVRGTPLPEGVAISQPVFEGSSLGWD